MAHGSRCAPESMSAKVDLSDLDLTTPAGAHEARARLRKQALILCWKLADSRSISSRETVADCSLQALQEALAKLANRGAGQ